MTTDGWRFGYGFRRGIGVLPASVAVAWLAHGDLRPALAAFGLLTAVLAHRAEGGAGVAGVVAGILTPAAAAVALLAAALLLGI
ncbi:MAG TPA: hypothetical protein VFQ85_04200 [Mycobacteriales bacterium]|jgi:hypothetical protein|nr:hypothetical protein [Mycobacteriales bacterium]